MTNTNNTPKTLAEQVAADNRHMANLRQNLANTQTHRDRTYLKMILDGQTDVLESLRAESDETLALAEATRSMLVSYQVLCDSMLYNTQRDGKNGKAFAAALAKHDVWQAPFFAVLNGRATSIADFFRKAVQKSPHRKSLLTRVRDLTSQYVDDDGALV
jgi:hypothetical protein